MICLWMTLLALTKQVRSESRLTESTFGHSKSCTLVNHFISLFAHFDEFCDCKISQQKVR